MLEHRATRGHLRDDIGRGSWRESKHGHPQTHRITAVFTLNQNCESLHTRILRELWYLNYLNYLNKIERLGDTFCPLFQRQWINT